MFETAERGRFFRAKRVESHAPLTELALLVDALTENGEFRVAIVAGDFFDWRLDGGLRAFEDLQEAAVVINKHAGDSQPGIVDTRLAQKFREIRLSEWTGGRAAVD